MDSYDVALLLVLANGVLGIVCMVKFLWEGRKY